MQQLELRTHWKSGEQDVSSNLFLVRFARDFVNSCNPIMNNLSCSLLLFDFLESRFSARIIKKLFQCAGKPAASETIDDRIDPTGYEYAGVY